MSKRPAAAPESTPRPGIARPGSDSSTPQAVRKHHPIAHGDYTARPTSRHLQPTRHRGKLTGGARIDNYTAQRMSQTARRCPSSGQGSIGFSERNGIECRETKRYTPEFKEQAARRWWITRRGHAQVARELSKRYDLGFWVKAYRKNSRDSLCRRECRMTSGAGARAPQPGAGDGGDFPKKAAAYFAKEHR